jgi:RNA polymerase sigma-70 factor (ECF subfamily)
VRWSTTEPAATELDDLAHQAAADAVIAIIAKIGRFRGESRFTTWAYKFVVLEVSNKIGRHFWQRRTWPMEQEEWDRLPDRFGIPPADQAEGGIWSRRYAGPSTKS